MEQVPGLEALAWLEERAPGGDVTGYDAAGWDANAWVLHAMYETDGLPEGISHDDLARIERSTRTGEEASDRLPAEIADLLNKSTVISGYDGRAAWPDVGWRRLRWNELAGRMGVDPFAGRAWPSHSSFPFTSWPITIDPPDEGSLDREQLERVVSHLAAVTPGGLQADCFAFYTAVAGGDWDDPVVYRCKLAELSRLLEFEDWPGGSPSNVWPAARDWFVYTDWDLWGTRISGSTELIHRLVADPELETVFLDP